MSTIFTVFIAFITSFLLSQNTFAAEDQLYADDNLYESIEKYIVDIRIEANAQTKITESIIYNFGSNERHGIFRIIPLIKTNEQGDKFRMRVQDIQVYDENQNKYTFENSIQNDEVNIKIGDPNKTISGQHTYVLGYNVTGALTYFDDHDELYWNAVGTEWTSPIKEVLVRVTLPQDINLDDIRNACFTGTSGSNAQNCVSTIKDGQIVFSNTSPLYANEGFTIVVGIPTGIVAHTEPEKVVPFFQTLVGRITFIFIIVASFFWYLLLPLIIVYRWYRYGRDPIPPIGETVWFSPPKGKNNRPLTPVETGGLVDEIVHSRDLFATIVDLARNGYFQIIERKPGELTLKKLHKSVNDVLPFEHALLDAIFAKGDEVELKTLKLYSKLESIKSSVYQCLVKEGFFLKNPQTTRTIYTVISVLSMITFNPMLLLTSWIFGQHMPRKTLEGAQASTVGKSLRNFLKSQEKKLSFQAKNQLFFEKLLPYAVAFGVEKEWAKRFEKITMKPPDWYSPYDSKTFNSALFANSISRSYTKSFATVASSSTSSSGFSSGFSGGSSGGGGGGGGGGSW